MCKILQNVNKHIVPLFPLAIKLKSSFYSLRLFDGIKQIKREGLEEGRTEREVNANG